MSEPYQCLLTTRHALLYSLGTKLCPLLTPNRDIYKDELLSATASEITDKIEQPSHRAEHSNPSRLNIFRSSPLEMQI